MIAFLKRFSWVTFGLIAAGCASPVTQRTSVEDAARAREEKTQQMLAIRTQAELTNRLWNVGYSVLKGAASECKDHVRQSAGFSILSRERLPAKGRDLAASALDIDDRLKVYGVYRGSAAEAAGVQPGDILIDRASPVLTPAGSDESREASLARLPKGQPVPLRLQRGGKELVVTLVPDTVCDYPLKLMNGGEVNAYADGKAIYVTRGMMRFASEDRELALVVGHELGHNTMGHINKKQANAAVGAIFDVLAAAYGVNTQAAFSKAGGQAYSQEFESEADYVGLYYLARAGYETEGAANFWRRMAAEYPASIKSSYSASHPATTERFLSLETVGGEVKAKQTSGAALVPNLASK